MGGRTKNIWTILKGIILIALVVIIIAIIVTAIIKNNKQNEESIIDNSIEVTAVTREERIENAINSTISQLERAGATVSRLNSVTLGEAEGYAVSLNGETIEVYYLERAKLASIVGSTTEAETTITINGSTKNAMVFTNVFILNCNSAENKELINNTLSTTRK